MEIPYTALSDAALKGIVEEFVTREGTDYGQAMFDLSEKVEHVLNDIRKGKVRIFYDDETQTCNLATGNQIQKARDEEAARAAAGEDDEYPFDQR